MFKKKINNLSEHVYKAYEEARKREIEANTIIIDKGIAFSNGFNYAYDNKIQIYPPMVFGLRMKYAQNLPNNASFILLHSKEETEGERKIRVFETILKKKVNILDVAVSADYDTYMSFFKMWNWHGEYDEYILTETEFLEIKEYLK